MLHEYMRLRAESEDLRCQVREAGRRAQEAGRVLDDFVEKLRALPRTTPTGVYLTRMIIDLGRELERNALMPVALDAKHFRRVEAA